MKILIVYFSGTGNTYYCAKYLRERLARSGNEVRLYSIEKLPKEETACYDLLIAGFPVYACNLPAVMRDYLSGVPLTATKRAFLFCTKGFYSGNVLKKAAGLLEASGYRISGTADVTMPGSDGLAFLAKDSAAARKLCDRDFKQIVPLDSLIEKIETCIKNEKNAASEVPAVTMRTKLSGVIMDRIFQLIYAPIEHWMKGKLRTDENCIRCGLCARNCPSRNIKVTGKGVSFGKACYLCMRCIHQCPQAAIQIGKMTVGKMRWRGPDGDYNPSKPDNI